jgi:hypothetical protein
VVAIGRVMLLDEATWEENWEGLAGTLVREHVLFHEHPAEEGCPWDYLDRSAS